MLPLFTIKQYVYRCNLAIYVSSYFCTLHVHTVITNVDMYSRYHHPH